MPRDRQPSMADPPFCAMPSREDRTAAERQRRRRERRQAGAVAVAGDVPASLVEGLIERGLLDCNRSEDKPSVFRALIKAAAGWISRKRHGVTG